MRTRFLGTDYFGSAPIETLEFLWCPPPDLPPAHFSNIEQLQHCFDEVSVLDISNDIEKLPIENSLSKFFSDVLPEIIDVEFGDFADDQSSAGTACFDMRSSVSEHMVEIDASQKNSEIFSEGKGNRIDDLASETLQEKDEKAFDVEGRTGFELVQFEVLDVNLSLLMQEYNLLYQMENVQIFSETPQLANEVDMPTLELRQQDFLDIQHSIYSVDSLFTQYFIEQKADLLEDSSFTTEKVGSPHKTFFLLEIDEAGLGIFNNISIMDELITFEDIEFQKWTQEDELTNNEKELLGFKEFDLIEYLSNHCLAMQCVEHQVPCSNFFEEIDFIGDSADSEIRQGLSFHLQKSDNISVSSRSIILYEEFQFIDLEPCIFSKVFCEIASLGELETLEEELFGEAMKLRSFDELIVSYELALMDDSFKSLPVPILSDSQNIGSLHSFIEESLNKLEHESSSMFDSLYLDWHVLEEDDCNYNKHFSCRKMLEEIDTYSIDSSLNIFDNGIVVFNFVLSDGTSDKPNSGESKEMLNIPGLSVSPISFSGVASGKLLNNGQSKRVDAEISSEIGAEVSESVESLAQFNDLDFFLNPHDCTRRVQSKNSNLSLDSHGVLLVDSSSDHMAAYANMKVPLQQWNVRMHKIKLSDEILGLIDNFKRSFLAILENDKELVENQYPSRGLDDISLLSLPKEKLMHRITKAGVPITPLAHGDENIISLVALCAIKQMAWYLCYYGFHTTYLYIDKLTRSLQCLKYRLSFLQSLIKDICVKAEKEIIKFHPSLSVIKELLQSNIIKRGKKLLIVAEQVFWWPLKRLLTSMKISYDQPQNSWRKTDQQDECMDFSDAISIMFQSDCGLVSHEYITTSFPFDKFGIILEYGGSCELPRVLTVSPELDNYPVLYFLKVEMEDLGAPKALCDGVDMPKKIRRTMKGDPQSISVHKVEELLNFVPVEENCSRGQMDAVDGDDACSKMPEHCVSLATESDIFHENKPSFPDMVIVVNTQNFDKEMVISRRSTYQKILALEKEGAQVVERDINLPADILVDAAVCLAWYDLKNIGKKSSALDEAFSCLPLSIENIAASILTSLSFAFSCCILVFEGEKSFLAGVMESSDELYAAAASLGIDFQIFCSYSSEMTDEIILSCIESATKQIRGLYPGMSESESLAESFLTAFPSINPLSAHAILSSGRMLVEFLEWSCDSRIQAVQKYKIPDGSVALLSLLSKYGEHDDSKSAMTDSSSSVSYTPDMQNCHPKSNPGKMKRKWDENLQSIEMCANGSHIEPLKLFSDGRSIFSKAAGPNDFWKSQYSEIIDECGKPALSAGDKLFGQDEKLDANMAMITSKISPYYDFQIAECYQTLEEKKRPKIPGNGRHSGTKERLDMAARNELSRHYYKNSGNQQEDFVGEVIDIDGTATFEKDISNADLLSFSPHKVEKGSTRTARKLFFGSSSFPDFPSSPQIKSDSDSWFSLGDYQNSSRKGKKYHFDSNFNNTKVYPKQKKGLLHERAVQKSTSSSEDLPSLEKDDVHHGGTPLWNAIHSNESLRESPWTIEFLNRIKEKSRLREQSLSCGLSAPCVGYSRNIPKATKRKSPSIIEFYKYEGDVIGKRMVEQKRQKQSVQPACSAKKGKASASILPTWTPVDKRAKQTLSFTTSGNEAQSKLIWSDKNFHARSRRIEHPM